MPVSSESLKLFREAMKLSHEEERIRLFWGDMVLDIPEPEWLIKGILPQQALAVLYGPPGVAKSLMAQDWSMCIGNGWKWFGKETVRGPVLYIMGEGQGGLPSRLRAWIQSRKAQGVPENVGWIMNPLHFWRVPGSEFTDDQVTLLTMVEEHKPMLVVVDTMAANSGGMNENSQQDMNAFLQMCQEVQKRGATVLVIHHAAKATGDVRGSTVLKGAADTVMKMSPAQGSNQHQVEVRFDCIKQKDGAPFDSWRFRLEQHVVDPETERTSVTLALTSGPTEAEPTPMLTEKQREALLAYMHLYEEDGRPPTLAEWASACEVVKTQAARWKVILLDNGYLDTDGIPTDDAAFIVEGRL